MPLLVTGVLGTGGVLGSVLGLVEEDDSLAVGVFAFVYASFLVLGAAFAAMVWLTRGAAGAADVESSGRPVSRACPRYRPTRRPARTTVALAP